MPFWTSWTKRRRRGFSSMLVSANPLPCECICTSHIAHRKQDNPPPHPELNSSLIPSAVKALISGQQITEAAFKQFVRDTPTRDRKGQLCKLLPVPLFKSPSDQRTHLGMGASNHFKESSLFGWMFWGHGPRQVMGSHFYAGSLISYRGLDSGFAPYPPDLPVFWLFFEVSSRLVGRKAVGNRRKTVRRVVIVFLFCALFWITQPLHIPTPGLFSCFLICRSDFWANKCGLKTQLFTLVRR